VFSVALSTVLWIASSKLKNEDTIFFYKEVQTSLYFYERGASFKKVWEPMN